MNGLLDKKRCLTRRLIFQQNCHLPIRETVQKATLLALKGLNRDTEKVHQGWQNDVSLRICLMWNVLNVCWLPLITLFPGYLKVSPPAPLHWKVRWETLGTRLITTVKEVWIPGLNKHRFWWFYFSVYSLFSIAKIYQTPQNTPLGIVFELFSLFGYPDETLSLVFDILLERRLFVLFLHWRALLA